MKRKMTRQEAGRLGGKATARKYDRAHFQEIGRRGGQTTLERYGSEEMARRGANGFRSYAEKYHGGCAERAAFALAKAGRVQLVWRQTDLEFPISYCVKCGEYYKWTCPKCHRDDPVPF
jgi:uncharacterized protein